MQGLERVIYRRGDSLNCHRVDFIKNLTFPLDNGFRKKNIHASVDCPQDITLAHDRKWTTETLFNILDNTVTSQKQVDFLQHYRW